MLLFLWIFGTILLKIGDAEVIEIDQGFVNGTVLKSRGGSLFHAFYGLPYAAPPVGSLRFEPPASPPTWTGIRQATQKSQPCLQVSSAIPGVRKAIFSGAEDCLYLSVFTREIKPKKLLPVLVYLHGGGFRSGNGDMYGPHVFMDKSLVMVALNHRLGFFGYFSSGNDTIPGNFGLKDQVAALKWVRKNINRFGGNPNCVTILGHNSGAACAHLHTVSAQSKGLFHRVIIESGNAVKYFLHDSLEDTKANFVEALEKTSCNRSNIDESVACLKSLPADLLNKVVNAIPAKNKFEIKYQPVIENNDVDAFLTLKDRYQVPYISAIIGFNSAEGLNEATNFFKFYSNMTELNLKLNEDLPLMLQSMKIKENLIDNIGKTIMKFYFTNGIVTKNDGQKLCNLLGDIFRSLTMMDMILTYPGAKYFYIYDYKNAVTMTRQLFNDTSSRFGITGAGHSDELLSLFSTNVSDQLTAEDQKLSEQVISYWVNFMYSGNPNQPEKRNIEWKLTNKNFEHLHISQAGFNIKSEPLGDRYSFWSSLVKNLQNKI